MTSYKFEHRVVWPEPELVDGVELETKGEREAKQLFVDRLRAHMDEEVERVLYGHYYVPKLPKP